VTAPSLLEALQELELEAHHPGRCTTRERLDQLLHPEFHEVGRSGNPYDRERTIGLLLHRAEPLPVASGGFKVSLLASDMALLTYSTALRQADGSLANHTLRSSLWIRCGDIWQLRYHQGTPSQTTWQ
jgi:hypothetical protein